MRMFNFVARGMAVVAALAVMAPVKAATPAPEHARLATAADMDVLYAAPGDLNYAYGPKGSDLLALTADTNTVTATISVTYTGFSAQAQAAFQAAINIWAQTISSPVPIRIRANWTPLGTGILGSAGPTVTCSNSAHGLPNTFYPAALADKLQGTSYCAGLASPPETAEITARFNSAFPDWEFGTGGTGVPGKYSFMTVVMHEVGHGLGIFGGASASGGVGDFPGFASSPSEGYIYDRFTTVGPGGALLLNIPRPSTQLGAQLVSNNTFWNGANAPNAKVETHNMTTQYGHTTDNGWLQGSSYSHVDDVLYSGTPNGLMTFQLASNEVYTDVGPVVRGMFIDEGWTITPVAPPPPPPPPPTVSVPGDFNGDGRADVAVFRPSTGTWFVQGQAPVQWGIPGDIPVPGDYNGDHLTDRVVFRPSNGTWYVPGTAAIQFGRTGDLPVPADYNGDGKTDIAVFRTSDSAGATWYFASGAAPIAFGLRGDIPVPADYDGDGKADPAVFRPSTGFWYVLRSTLGTVGSVQFGLPGDIPVPAKYDTDALTDFAVFRPSTGTWYLSMSAAGSAAIQFGLPGDVPVPLDMDGDGVSELSLFRPNSGTWFGYNRITPAVGVSQQLGLAGDVPAMQRPRLPSTATSDFDGDGRSDISIFRNVGGVAYWYQKFSSTGYATTATVQWGLGSDVKVPGDYDGDGKTDTAVFRPSTGTWYIVQSASNTTRQLQWGLSTDVPVPADYDGDGKTDPAVYRPTTGGWYVLLSTANYGASTFDVLGGVAGDIPLAGDFDGDGRADFGVYRPSNGTWYLKTTTTTYTADRMLQKQFGLPTDIPLVADFDGDGRADLGLFRPSTGRWLAIDALTAIQPINRQLGLSSDTPDSHDFDGDGVSDAAVFRPSTGQWFFTLSSNGLTQIVQWGLNGDQPVVRAGGGW